jgi:hypothetical protein
MISMPPSPYRPPLRSGDQPPRSVIRLRGPEFPQRARSIFLRGGDAQISRQPAAPCGLRNIITQSVLYQAAACAARRIFWRTGRPGIPRC